jgi:hypothetical protein
VWVPCPRVFSENGSTTACPWGTRMIARYNVSTPRPLRTAPEW